MAGKVEEKNNEQEKPICFVIMPFSDPEGYEPGHFRKVYDHIIKPAIEDAGYKPFRMDDSKKSTVIHADMFEHLVNDPIAICDLSSKNPNVLYELGVRHAFDKPTVLLQEAGQTPIFDINGVNTLAYRKERRYDEVLEDRVKISNAIRETAAADNKYSFMNLVKMHTAPQKRDGQISGEERIEILLRDLTRKGNNLEGSVSNKQSTVQWEPFDSVSEIELAKRKLQRVAREATNIITAGNAGKHQYPPVNIVVAIKNLESAIIDYQSVGGTDEDLIQYARTRLLELQLVSKNQEQLVTIE